MNKYHWFLCFLFVLGLSWLAVHNYGLRQEIGEVEDAITLLGENIHKAKMIRHRAEALQLEMSSIREQMNEAADRLPVKFEEFAFLADIKTYASDTGVEILQYIRGKSQSHEKVVEHPFAIKARGNYHDFGFLFAQIANSRQMVRIRSVHLVNPGDMDEVGVVGWFVTSFYAHREPTWSEMVNQIEKEEEARKARLNRRQRGN